MHVYSDPVAKLLTFGEAKFGEDWPDYPNQLGLGEEHVTELIAMVCDPSLYANEAGDEGWATVHARRALGQLKATKSVAPLLDAMNLHSEGDDYFLEEMPQIFAMMGPSTLPDIEAGLANGSLDEYTRIMCAESLAKMGKAIPEAREECVGILARQLAKHEGGEQDYNLNGFVVSSLVDLNAVESASVIEEAFAVDCVFESIVGDWPYVRFRLGLGPEPPPRRYPPLPGLPASIAGDLTKKRPKLDKVKQKRKAEKKARKQGRKR